MRAIPFIAVIYFLIFNYSYSQTVTNGNFNSGATGWGCNPETNAEVVYGGASATNIVAEVDEAAGLCQTITGFTVGSYYRLSFLCSRRTNCGPTLQSMDVTLSGGGVNMNVSRNGTAFTLTGESANFVASSASHTLTFTSTTTGTCNLLVDNIQITLISGLPVELSAFTTICSDDKVIANWTTESESRADYFSLEGSEDGSEWLEVARVKSQVNSQTRTNYSKLIEEGSGKSAYYRLVLKNLDGTQEILSVKSLNCERDKIAIYPNPTRDWCQLNLRKTSFRFSMPSGNKFFRKLQGSPNKKLRLIFHLFHRGFTTCVFQKELIKLSGLAPFK